MKAGAEAGASRCLHAGHGDLDRGRHDVEAIAKLVKETDALLVVDGITGLGTTHFDVDGWGIDVLIGGSQKAVMIPPGLAYLSVSEKAWAAMEKSKNPRYYFDLRKERKNAAKGESAYTPAVALIAGLGAALDYIAGQAGGDLEKGRIALIDNAQVNAAATRAGLVALGFTLFAPTSPAAAATAVAVPEGMNSGDVVKALKTRFALVTANGQGEMQGKIFRVAHLGFFDYLDTVALLGAMEHIAKDTLELPVEYGQAVAAAQQVYAEAVKLSSSESVVSQVSNTRPGAPTELAESCVAAVFRCVQLTDFTDCQADAARSCIHG